MNKFQINYIIFIGFLVFTNLIIHTFSLFNSKVDSISVFLILILLILPIIPNLKKIKWGDLEAHISTKEIKKIEESAKKIKPLQKNQIKGYTKKEVNELREYLFSLVEIDHILALAKLRIEMETAIGNVYKTIMKLPKKEQNPLNIGLMISKLYQKEIIDKNQLNISKEVTTVCNRAIHGENIEKKDAISIITIGMKIISYFYGYSAGIIEGRKKRDLI